MRRRYLLGAFTVASLLLLAATLACWLAVNHVYHRAIGAELRSHGGGRDGLSATRAKVRYYRVRGDYFRSEDVNMSQGAAPVFRRTNHPDGGYAVAVGIPYWLLVIASAPCPLLCLTGVLRRRARRRRGLCLGCGYDLRATPGRCPECGAACESPPHNPPMQRTGDNGTR